VIPRQEYKTDRFGMTPNVRTFEPPNRPVRALVRDDVRRRRDDADAGCATPMD
jgi:hypothetical protein